MNINTQEGERYTIVGLEGDVDLSCSPDATLVATTVPLLPTEVEAMTWFDAPFFEGISGRLSSISTAIY